LRHSASKSASCQSVQNATRAFHIPQAASYGAHPSVRLVPAAPPRGDTTGGCHGGMEITHATLHTPPSAVTYCSLVTLMCSCGGTRISRVMSGLSGLPSGNMYLPTAHKKPRPPEIRHLADEMHRRLHPPHVQLPPHTQAAHPAVSEHGARCAPTISKHGARRAPTFSKHGARCAPTFS
jgi:hypothetical protein